jgi:spermidine synthase
LLLAFGSGCAALAHELLWTRRLIDLLGASAASSTRVFGCFFLGLALGAAITPGLARRIRRPWRAVAIAETGVAVLALPALYLPLWTDWIWPALGAERLIGWQGAWVKLVVSAAVVFPPAFFMGVVLPLLARAVLRERYEMSRHGVWLYAVNTLGGVFGLILVTLVLLRLFGAAGSMWWAIIINLVVAGGALLLDRGQTDGEYIGRSLPSRHVPRRVLVPALAVAFVSGAGILAFEVLALQLIGLKAPLSFFAPMAVLTVVVLLLGVSAMMVPPLIERAGGPRHVLWAALGGAAMAAMLVPFWYLQLVQWIDPGPRATLIGFLVVLLGVTFLALGPTLLLAGMVFPSLLAWVGSEGGDRHGRWWGWLLASNGLGGFIGAEVTYGLLIPKTGIHAGIGSVAVFYALAALAWLVTLGPRKAGALIPAIGVCVVAVLLTLGPLSWLPHLDWQGVIIIDEQTGREGPVAVVDSPDLGRRIVLSNQYVLGGTKYRYDQARMGHLPLMLHDRPRKVAFIGLATGITPGAALQHRDVNSLHSIELSSLVVQAADKHFSPYHHGITRDARARIVVEDGRTYLAASPEAFDLVVGDLFLPWSPGEGRLYSLEHFHSVRKALRPNGVFCQWLAMYQLTPSEFDLICATFGEVFPQVFLFRNSLNTRDPAVALVGFRDGELDWTTIQARCDAIRRTNQVRDPLVRHAEGLEMLYLGRIDNAHDIVGARNTLSNMRLELSAADGRVTRLPAARYLSGERWLEFGSRRLANHFGSSGGQTGARAELAWLGQHLSVWDVALRHRGPLSREDQLRLESLRREIRGAFPESMRMDGEADWTQWPSDVSLVRGRD